MKTTGVSALHAVVGAASVAEDGSPDRSRGVLPRAEGHSSVRRSRTSAHGRLALLSWLAALVALAIAAWALVAHQHSAASNGRLQVAQTPPTATHAAQPQALPAGALGSISTVLGRADSAYAVRGLAAANPAQRFDASFSSAGATVVAGGHHLGLALVAFGRGRTPARLGPAQPRASANRVVYRHAGLSEWYANGPFGLEQGFELRNRPTGAPASLRFTIDVSGNLVPRLDGNTVRFGTRLRYGGLVATDARGRILRSSLSVSGRRIVIAVDDRGAQYPLRIDPILQTAELVGPSGLSGWSVAISGNTIVVGSPQLANGKDLDQGGAEVFVEPARGWQNTNSATAELTPSDGGYPDEFGQSVAINASTIVVGSPYHGVKYHEQGAAYIFVMPAGGWTSMTQTAELTASDAAALDKLGYSVGISGDTVVAGAPGADAAYVFEMPAAGWSNTTETAKLTGPGANGSAVAISGDTIAEGSGALDVFVAPTAGWTDTSSPTAELPGPATSLAMSGNTIVAGDSATTPTSVYVMPAGGWSSAASPTATLFGASRSVAIDGSTIVAGSNGATIGCNAGQGAMFAATMPGSGWGAAPAPWSEFIESAGHPFDRLGDSVAVSGSTVVGGAPFANAAYVFQLPSSSSPVINTALPTITQPQYIGQKLTANPGTWTSPDTVHYRYQWQRCGTNIPGATGSSYTLTKSDIRSLLTVSITATDTEGASSQVTSLPAGPIPEPPKPQPITQPSITGNLWPGQTLTVNVGTWPADDPLTFTCYWFQTVLPTCSKLLTTANYRVNARFAVAAVDAWGQRTTIHLFPGVIGLPPVSNTALPAVSGTPQDGQRLSANTGSWSSPVPLTFSFNWERCSSTGASCADLGDTTSSYTPTWRDVGHEVTVVVTAMTGIEHQQVMAAATPVGPVAKPPAPSIQVPPAVSGKPAEGQTLKATTGTWLSPDELSYSYQWMTCSGAGADCVDISRATSSEYTPSRTNLGHDIAVEVSATDKESQTGHAAATPVGPVVQ